MVSDEPEAYYEVADGSEMPCSLREAQLWLIEGYFTSTSRLTIRGRDGKAEWRTVAEWMERNGREMPFTEWMPSEEEKKEQEEELERLHEEMVELSHRRENLQRVIIEAEERRSNVQTTIRRISEKFTTYSLPSILPQITPRAGLDPFALLRSCAGARKKLDGDIFGRFRQLRIRFDQCDKKRLVLQTSVAFADHRVTKCTLCQVKIDSSNNVVEHICGRKHLEAFAIGERRKVALSVRYGSVSLTRFRVKMCGSVCGDAFFFWWNTVEKLKLDEYRTKPEPASVAHPARAASNTNKGSYMRQPIPPPDLPELAILRRTSMTSLTPSRDDLSKMLSSFEKCDKSKLDNDHTTSRFFEKPLLCLICNRCAIDKASNLVAHITSNAHWKAIVEVKCGLSREAIDFWMSAIQRASL